MKLQTAQFRFAFLTPCFCGGADNSPPQVDRATHRIVRGTGSPAELRVPSVRGQVREWHRVTAGSLTVERIWGGTAGSGGGSQVALLIDQPFVKHKTPERLLPHCDPNNRQERAKAESHRNAIPAQSEFTLTLQRLVGCTDIDWAGAQGAVKLWLLVGSLGLRSNRAAGGVWPVGNWAPMESESLRALLVKLGLTDWSVALVGEKAGWTPPQLREAASDTIKGNAYGHIFGNIHPNRQPSPTRLKVIRLGTHHCLLAMAERKQIKCEDGARRTVLAEAERLLQGKPSSARWKAPGSWNHIIP